MTLTFLRLSLVVLLALAIAWVGMRSFCSSAGIDGAFELPSLPSANDNQKKCQNSKQAIRDFQPAPENRPKLGSLLSCFIGVMASFYLGLRGGLWLFLSVPVAASSTLGLLIGLDPLSILWAMAPVQWAIAW